VLSTTYLGRACSHPTLFCPIDPSWLGLRRGRPPRLRLKTRRVLFEEARRNPVRLHVRFKKPAGENAVVSWVKKMAAVQTRGACRLARKGRAPRERFDRCPRRSRQPDPHSMPLGAVRGETGRYLDLGVAGPGKAPATTVKTYRVLLRGAKDGTEYVLERISRSRVPPTIGGSCSCGDRGPPREGSEG
jgi:hypothetical protein